MKHVIGFVPEGTKLMLQPHEWRAEELTLCRSDQGDGGWSLHAPGTSDEEIATGEAPCLASGIAEWDEETGEWTRPNEADYQNALRRAAAMARDKN